MALRFVGLPLAPFRSLFILSDAALQARGISRQRADESGFPCRVGLRDAEPGESLLLLSFQHQPAASPYRAAGPIFVCESAGERYDALGPTPESLRRRLLSLRAYDRWDCIVEAEVVEGTDLAPLAERLLADPAVAYLHAHYARRGCYACRIERG